MQPIAAVPLVSATTRVVSAKHKPCAAAWSRCGQAGHWSRDCPSAGGGGSSQYGGGGGSQYGSGAQQSSQVRVLDSRWMELAKLGYCKHADVQTFCPLLQPNDGGRRAFFVPRGNSVSGASAAQFAGDIGGNAGATAAVGSKRSADGLVQSSQQLWQKPRPPVSVISPAMHCVTMCYLKFVSLANGWAAPYERPVLSLVQGLQQFYNTVGQGGPSAAGGRGSGRGRGGAGAASVCFKCQQAGHWAAQCPNG